MRLPLFALLAALALAGPAFAAQHIYSYDPADAQTKSRVDQGLTFVFDRGVLGMRVREVLATQARARAVLEPVGERDLHVRLDRLLPRGERSRDLYVITDAEQGPAMVRAFCPGSTKGWLLFSAMRARRPLTVHALGDDGNGKAKLCATLKLSFRGEWRTPPVGPPPPYGGPIAPSGRSF